MYKSIKHNNHNSLNLKIVEKTLINSPILPQKIPPQVARPGYPLAAPSMLILTQPGEGNSHLSGKGRRTLPLRVLIPKNLSMLKL